YPRRLLSSRPLLGSVAFVLRSLHGVLLGGPDCSDVFRGSAHLLAYPAALLLRAGACGAARSVKILFLDQFSEMGGAQRGLIATVDAVLKRGWELCAALPGDGPVLGQLRSRGVMTA